MSEFKASGFRDEFGNGGPDLVGITTMTSPYYFVPPSGSTAERPRSPPPGMLRFNTDIGRLEVWRNDHWATILGESPNLGGGTGSNTGTGTRGLTGGGYVTTKREEIDYFTISTLGNSQDFGDLSNGAVSNNQGGGASSPTRGVIGGGRRGSSKINEISAVQIQTTGNSLDFGDLSNAARDHIAATSNGHGGL